MSNTPHTAESFKKASDLFFNDGDIIIAAQRPESDVTTLFKLHRRILATHAQAFSSLLVPPTAPGGIDANEYFEGTPVVRLSDDPADLAKFFEAMYVPSSMATNATDAYPLLLLADKYVADDIECMIECQMRQDWPEDVYQWDAFENRTILMYHMQKKKGGGGDAWDTLVPEPASYVRLARLAKVCEPTRVAAAFYLLSRMCVSNDWEKKSIASECEDPTPTQLVKMRRAMWSLLTQEEMRRVERGREKVASLMLDYMTTIHTRVSLDDRCADKLQMIVRRMASSGDALADMLELCDEHAKVMGSMCKKCRWRVTRETRSGREAIFHELPKYFEVIGNERAHLIVTRTEDAEFVC